MNDIYEFGDAHLSSMNPWNRAVSFKILEWFKDTFKNENKENYAIFLGDVIDKAASPGDITDIVFKLFDFCSKHFKKTYVLMGNHDIKAYRDFTFQTGLKFINNFEDVELIDSIRLLDIDNRKILCMPFMKNDILDKINEYYSSYDWSKEGYNKEIADLAIGHWTIKDESDIRFRDGVDISNIPAKQILCGHIHNRPDERYIGSLYPLNAEEMKCKYPRVYKIWHSDKTWTDVPLPEFLTFETIEYGSELKKDDVIRVYTVSEAPSETDAYKKYEGFFIKGVTKLKNKNQKDVSVDNNGISTKNDVELFQQMVSEQNLTVTRSAYRVIMDLLATRSKTN